MLYYWIYIYIVIIDLAIIVRVSCAQSGTAVSSGSGGEGAADAVRDDTSPEELLAELEEVANDAADSLAEKNPKGKVHHVTLL